MGKPHPPQTAAEVRGLVLSTMILMRMGKLTQEKMEELAPLARHAVRVRGIFPWERDFMEALADLFDAQGAEQIAAAEAKFKEAMAGLM